jgi:hypothetical protein
MKFHGIMFAVNQGVPFINIAETRKTQALLHREWPHSTVRPTLFAGARALIGGGQDCRSGRNASVDQGHIEPPPRVDQAAPSRGNQPLLGDITYSLKNICAALCYGLPPSGRCGGRPMTKSSAIKPARSGSIV